MSFVTVFTVTAMSFVLLVPALMIVVLASALGPRSSRSGQQGQALAAPASSDRDHRVSPARRGTVGLAA